MAKPEDIKIELSQLEQEDDLLKELEKYAPSTEPKKPNDDSEEIEKKLNDEIKEEQTIDKILDFALEKIKNLDLMNEYRKVIIIRENLGKLTYFKDCLERKPYLKQKYITILKWLAHSKEEYETLSTEEKQAREKRQTARAIKAKQNAEEPTKACGVSGCSVMGGKTKNKRKKKTKRKRTNTRRNRKRR
jgi:hypothetical protein